MPRSDPRNWFEEKRPWSVYKDLVLAYYLKPYLEKVKKLGQPVAIVDMFAGPGLFKSGEEGSPLLIAKALKPLHDRGVSVEAHFIEASEDLFGQLQTNLAEIPFAHVCHGDCFECIDWIEALARRATTFLYIDPLNVTGLYFDQLCRVYDVLKQHQSVEVLLIFMATAFMREAAALLSKEVGPTADEKRYYQALLKLEEADYEEPAGLRRSDTQSLEQQSQKLNRIAGGDYWRAIASGQFRSFREALDALVEAYKSQMRQWFQLVVGYPIVDVKAPAVPKYWMLLGSRYLPAVDLFNRAACKARRDQGVSWNTGESLFGAMELIPRASERGVDTAIDDCAKEYCPTTWEELRWKISAEMTGRFTDAEINAGIKRRLKSGFLRGTDPKHINNQARIMVSA